MKTNTLWQAKLTKFKNFLDRHSFSDSAIIIGTALIVGIGAGYGAVLFRKLIDFFQHLSYGEGGGIFHAIAPWHLILMPALGGLIVGPLIYKFAREAKGHGVPEVMEAVALKGGRIRPQVVVVKALASAVCIGTGGSVGREGPIAQIGSAIGSTIGQIFHLSDEKIRNLVACGAAGGIAATFNAPIAGAIFAIEVILGRIHALSFGSVVISAVTADVIAHIYEGDLRTFVVPEYSLGEPWELGLYAILGLLAAFASVGFSRILYASEDLWEKIRFPEYLKPALGGLLLGAIGLLTWKAGGVPRVYGVGYNSIMEALFGDLPFKIVLGLLLLKCLATITTLGSGGSGGVFAPSLYMGAMLGASFGFLLRVLFPSIQTPPGAFAMVGMAAFFSGAAHAPITSILILFEMTQDYRIILPLMLATVLSTFVSKMISKDSIYSLKLSRRGVHLESGTDVDVMQGISVGEVMDQKVNFVHGAMELTQLSEKFITAHRQSFVVADEGGALVGVVCISDLEKIMHSEPLADKTVDDIATKKGFILAYPDEPMWKALKRMVRNNISSLPVISREEPSKVIGMIGKGNIVNAYRQAIVKRADYQHKAEVLQLGKLNEIKFSGIEISADSAAIGKQIRNLGIPDHWLIVSLRRAGSSKISIPHGYSVIKKGDQLTVFTEDSKEEEISNLLIKGEGIAPESMEAKNKDLLIQPGSICANKLIRELELPEGCIIVSIKRDQHIIIPHGETRIVENDVIQVFGLLQDIEVVEGICEVRGGY